MNFEINYVRESLVALGVTQRELREQMMRLVLHLSPIHGHGDALCPCVRQELRAVEAVSSILCLVHDGMKVGVDGDYRVVVRPKSGKLRVGAVSLSVSLQDFLGEETLPPLGEQTYTVEIPRMEGPESHSGRGSIILNQALFSIAIIGYAEKRIPNALNNFVPLLRPERLGRFEVLGDRFFQNLVSSLRIRRGQHEFSRGRKPLLLGHSARDDSTPRKLHTSEVRIYPLDLIEVMGNFRSIRSGGPGVDYLSS